MSLFDDLKGAALETLEGEFEGAVAKLVNGDKPTTTGATVSPESGKTVNKTITPDEKPKAMVPKPKAQPAEKNTGTMFRTGGGKLRPWVVPMFAGLGVVAVGGIVYVKWMR